VLHAEGGGGGGCSASRPKTQNELRWTNSSSPRLVLKHRQGARYGQGDESSFERHTANNTTKERREHIADA
jgi:hypothetical protein